MPDVDPEATLEVLPSTGPDEARVRTALAAHWRRNVRLKATLLAIWAFAGLGCGVLWAEWLNRYSIGGFPLGFWFARRAASSSSSRWSSCTPSSCGGWTGGFVLLALLLAPSLRKFGRFTVPDFIGDRYESRVARLVAVACAVFVSFTYVAGQMRGVGIVFSRFLEVDVDVGVAIGMALVFVYATLGGMKGITWTQVAQYWVLPELESHRARAVAR